MKTILISMLLTFTFAAQPVYAFWGERKLIKILENEIDQKIQLGSELSREFNQTESEMQDSWVLSTIRLLTYPVVGVGLGIINLQIKPLVEIRWVRKARPDRLKPY